MTEPRIDRGMRILSAEGKCVGIVNDVTADAFKVHVRWSPDFWLGHEIVDFVTESVVQLLITKNAVSGAKLRLVRGLNTAA